MNLDACRPNPSANGRWGFRFVALMLMIAAMCVPAVARTWHIDRYNSVIVVEEDGTLLVTEEIAAVFEGSYQGLYRRIPVEYPGPHGTNYTLYLRDIEVTDDSGAKLKFESRTRGDYRQLKIFVPGAQDATRTVKIHYRVLNGMRWFEDHDELYWNATGTDWPVDITHATAFVQFPPSATGSLRAQAFTGFYGSTARDATSELKGAQVLFAANHELSPRSGMTINVYLPKGVLNEPSWLKKQIWWLGANMIVLLPLVSFIVMGGLWYLKGRDPDPGLSVAPMYEPPQGMTPAEVGTLIDDRIDSRDITSTLVDLAVRGYLKIEERNDKVLFFNNRDFTIHLLKPQAEWQSLAAHEQTLLSNMFQSIDMTVGAAAAQGAGSQSIGIASIRLSDLKNRFYLALPTVRTDIMSALKSKGMYLVDPDTANGYRILGIILIALPAVGVQMAGWYSLFRSPVVAFAAIAISAVIVWLFGRELTAKTMKGVRALVAVQGFREFMARVDGDRLRNFPPDTFEKNLPFAMALGVEKHWAKAFEGIIQSAPTWYVGPGYPGHIWSPMYFTNSMSTMSNSAYEAFTTSPRASSTGSGFGGGGFSSGGGFSGGGFGGGGGDAF